MEDVTPEMMKEALYSVIDPEVGINIVDLGLVYRLGIREDDSLKIEMTLTTRGCPAGDYITSSARKAVESIAQGRTVHVELVWNPPWNPNMITPEGRASM